jgi:hypothetical protein
MLADLSFSRIARLIHNLWSRMRTRHLLMPCILVVQLLLLALVTLKPRTITVPPAAGPLSLFEVRSPEARSEQPAAQPEPAEIIRPDAVVELKIESPAAPAEPVFNDAAAEQAGFGTTCDISDTLARAFTGSELVKAELARIGPESRSVANAIMFWDGGWVELPKSAPPEAIDTLRRAIVEGVRAAPPECLAQDITGPRFIAVTGAGPTMMLVLGSGAWRWEQLLIEANKGEAAQTITLNERTK